MKLSIFRDSGRNMVDQFSYSTSTKWTIIIDIAVIDTLCTPINDPEDNNSGNTDTPIRILVLQIRVVAILK